MNSAPYKVTIISGITGQDRSYLAEILLGKGCMDIKQSLRLKVKFNT